MRTSMADQTYEALVEYASQQALAQEFTATQDRILEWMNIHQGLTITRKTLSRHVDVLRTKGLLATRYTGDGIVYSLPDGVVKLQRIDEVPVSFPGVFDLVDVGLEVQVGNSDPGYSPAEWSVAWAHFFGAALNHKSVEGHVFNRRGEHLPPDREPAYSGALPF